MMFGTNLLFCVCVFNVSILWIVDAFIFDFIAKDKVPTRNPVKEISTDFEQVCFSRCNYMPKNCQSIVIENLGERNLICKFYNFTSDFHKELQANNGKGAFLLFTCFFTPNTLGPKYASPDYFN